MNPVEALELTLAKEEGSITLYKDLLTKHPVIRDLLTELLNEELKHKKLIEDKILEIMRG